MTDPRGSSRYYGFNDNNFQQNNNGNVFAYGAPRVPGGSRSRSGFANQQDQPTPTNGPQSTSPFTTPQDITNALNGTPPAVPTPRPAPTTAQVQENPGQWAGTSFDPTRNIFGPSPTGGANSLPQGSENVGGVGMYTGSNGPLDTSRFTPTTNQANVWYRQYFPNPGNVSYLQFADQLGRNALNAAGGNWTNGDAIATQQAYLDSPAGRQWLANLR